MAMYHLQMQGRPLEPATVALRYRVTDPHFPSRKSGGAKPIEISVSVKAGARRETPSSVIHTNPESEHLAASAHTRSSVWRASGRNFIATMKGGTGNRERSLQPPSGMLRRSRLQFLPQQRKKTSMNQSKIRHGLPHGAVVALCLFSGTLIGAEVGIESEDQPARLNPSDLPRVVITATRTETEPDRTASSVAVIDREMIEKRQYRLLADALRIVPGMAIVDGGSPGTLAGVFLRGTKTQNTLVLIDGRRVPANLAGSFNVESTPLDNVERVEVLSGPAGSLYGGQTIGGVINIITRDGRTLEKPETTTYFEAGSYGSFREGIHTVGAAGKLDWGFELARTDFQGQRINSQFQQTSGAGKVGYQLADSLRFDLDFRYYNADLGLPGAATVNNPVNHLLSEYWSISPRLVWETTDWWTQSLTFSTSHFRQAATDSSTLFGLNNRVTVRTRFWEYQSVFQLRENWSITAGASVQDLGYTRFNNDAPGIFNPGGNSYDVDQAETNWALFLQTQYDVNDRISLLAGLRRDDYSDFGEDVTWRAGASWRVPVTETLIHANYGTAFAPPTPQDREPALFGLATLLKPERSRGFEAGLKQPLLNDHVTASVIWFRNDIRQFIEFDPVLFALQQIDKARTQGVECQLDIRPCDRVQMSLGYNYLDADNISDQRRLVRRPRHTVTAQATVEPVEDVSMGLTATYMIDREDGFGATQSDHEDYLNVRLFANWQITPNIAVFGRIENLLGDDYADTRGFPALDTGAYAGVKVKF